VSGFVLWRARGLSGTGVVIETRAERIDWAHLRALGDVLTRDQRNDSRRRSIKRLITRRINAAAFALTLVVASERRQRLIEAAWSYRFPARISRELL